MRSALEAKFRVGIQLRPTSCNGIKKRKKKLIKRVGAEQPAANETSELCVQNRSWQNGRYAFISAVRRQLLKGLRRCVGGAERV